jgi:5-methylcytosine-specific restriction endonuclease McrA
MAIPKKIRDLVLARDGHCMHCGNEDNTLILHHRKNKGLGGSKLLDTPDNLLTVCSLYNGMMESDPVTARNARGWGHKLAVWEDTARPVFDVVGGWWFLLPDGSRVRVETREQF